MQMLLKLLILQTIAADRICIKMNLSYICKSDRIRSSKPSDLQTH